MRALSYTDVRGNLARTLNSVVDDHEEIIVARPGHEAAVIVSLADYESLKETAYLMRSPAMARRLHDAIQRLERGEGITKTLAELQAMAEEPAE